MTVRYLDREGKPQELAAEGLLATAIQHEIDHLNGKLIIDFLSRLKRDIIVRKFKKQAKADGVAAGSDPSRPAAALLRRSRAGSDNLGGEGSDPQDHARRLHGHARVRRPDARRHPRRRGMQVVAVYTQPPRPAGRGMAERKSPVHLLPSGTACRVLTPTSLKDEAEQQALRGASAPMSRVVVAYGLILPKPVLEAPRARLPQPARLGPAALARRRAHPARHHGRRHRDGGDRHAHGRRGSIPGPSASRSACRSVRT